MYPIDITVVLDYPTTNQKYLLHYGILIGKSAEKVERREPR
jgi:hypothetical protein